MKQEEKVHIIACAGFIAFANHKGMPLTGKTWAKDDEGTLISAAEHLVKEGRIPRIEKFEGLLPLTHVIDSMHMMHKLIEEGPTETDPA